MLNNNIKQFLRKMFGMKFWTLLRYIVYKDSRRAFIGKFKNYKLALNKSNTGKEYLNDALDETIYQKLIDSKSLIIEDYQYIFSTLISLFSEKEISILEVGGGHNPIFSYIKKILSKEKFQKINFNVLERKSVCKLIKHKEKNLKYIYSLEKIKKINYCFFTASAQYITDFETLINNIVKLKPKYFGLLKIFSYKGRNDFYSVQTNMRPSQFPIKIFSINKLINLFNIYNYKIVFIDEVYANQIYRLNFKEKIFKTNLVFRRT
jgi:putative methyltransferase (TIGR04325 family)